MIDEKKLIEEVRRIMFEADIKKSYVQEVFKDIVKAIESQPKVGEWIPVSERLPEKNRPVLVCGNSKCRGGRITMVGSCDNGYWFIQSSNNTLGFPCLEYEVVAWMPLPEPWKEENKSKEEH